ncbi:ribonuclease E inhibitor RraA/Dimethylmenaquinone methyltransferase [Mycena floridula]|nr:ribonuclease E inhibitor RraA/Dimethylmenaquinone methyltransferase [Mycena floridula]
MSISDFTSCEISDALVKLGVPQGGHVSDIIPFSPSEPVPICGPAYTVKMVLGTDESAPKLSSHFVDTAPAGSIIVIDAPRETPNAVWGGLMSAGAQSRSATGVVISGRCRDTAEHRALGFPVYARARSTLGQSPFTRPSAVNVSLEIGSVNIEPEDWIIADEDGVVCVPKGIVNKVVELATKGRAVDEKCMEDIKAGKGIQASFKLHRENKVTIEPDEAWRRNMRQTIDTALEVMFDEARETLNKQLEEATTETQKHKFRAEYQNTEKELKRLAQEEFDFAVKKEMNQRRALLNPPMISASQAAANRK